MHLPDEHFDAMVHALESCLLRQTGDDEADWPPLAAVFLDFFLTVFSSYRSVPGISGLWDFAIFF